MTPEEKKPIGVYVERMSVRIDAEGDYHQLGEFVSHVESMPQYVTIANAEITTENSGMMTAPAIGSGDDAGEPPKPVSQQYKIAVVVGLFNTVKDAL